MHTSINFKAMESMDKATKLKTLAGAIAFEFAKPSMAFDMAKQYAATAGVKELGGMKRADAPNIERIKGFLAQKYATPSDNPVLNDTADMMQQFFHDNMPEMDMGYSLVFDFVDMRGTGVEQFEIIDTNAGITFAQREPGEATKIRRNISESETVVKLLEFSDGLGILDRWIDYNKFWRIDEAIAEFRAKYFEKKAASHYALFTALGAGVNTAFSTDDVTTANTAAATIIRACKSKGYSLGTSPSFYALCAPEHVGRLEKMLTAQRGSAIVDQGTVGQPLAARIAGIIGTTEVPANSAGWYLVLPGRKIKRGDWKDLTVESDRDITVSATNMVGVGQYNAAIGDSDQVRRVLFA